MSVNKNYLKNCILSTENQIELVKNEYQKLGFPQYIIDLEVASLNIKLNELNRNLKNLSKKDGLLITFYPPGLESGEIQARTLSSILSNIQSLTDSIANAEYNHSYSNYGPVPNDILEKNSLIIREVKAGSFKVYLDFPDITDNQLSFEEANYNKDCSVLEKLNLLLKYSDNDDNLLQIISDLGDRVLSKYTNFMKSLKDNNTPIEIDFFNSKQEVNKINLNLSNIEKIYSNLNDKLKVSEKIIKVHGILTGANVRTNKFELYSDDNQRISGKISNNFKYDLKLGVKYIANITEITSTNIATNKSKTSKILNSLSEI